MKQQNQKTDISFRATYSHLISRVTICEPRTLSYGMKGFRPKKPAHLTKNTNAAAPAKEKHMTAIFYRKYQNLWVMAELMLWLRVIVIRFENTQVTS